MLKINAWESLANLCPKGLFLDVLLSVENAFLFFQQTFNELCLKEKRGPILGSDRCALVLSQLVWGSLLHLAAWQWSLCSHLHVPGPAWGMFQSTQHHSLVPGMEG